MIMRKLIGAYRPKIFNMSVIIKRSNNCSATIRTRIRSGQFDQSYFELKLERL